METSESKVSSNTEEISPSKYSETSSRASSTTNKSTTSSIDSITNSSSTSSSSQEETTSSSSYIYETLARIHEGHQTISQNKNQSGFKHTHKNPLEYTRKNNSSTKPHRTSANDTMNQTGKQYRNSPFGLKNHFLTMPPENDKKARNQDITSFNNEEIDCIETSSTSDSCDPDREWGHHKNRHQKQQRLNAHVLRSQPVKHLNGTVSKYDSSDAGLDAGKCNAKQAQLSSIDHNPSNDSNISSRNNGSQLDKEGKCDQSSLLVRFSSIMYATFLVILGCIFHISELRQKSKNSNDHIYTIVVALIGIAWLFFLQIDLLRYKRFASRYILIESIFSDHQAAAAAKRLASEDQLSSRGSRSTTSSAASLVHDRLSLNTEVIFKKTAYKMHHNHELANRMYRYNHHNNKNHDPSSYRPMSELGSTASMGLNLNMLNSNVVANENRANESSNPLEPAYKFLHGKMGANFYLKCGMAAFCFGHVIHEGLRFGQQLYFFGNGNLHCRDLAALIAHLITPLYSFYQLFMMFKYSNLVINRHKTLAKFGLMHIIGTSVTFWFRTIMEEAFEDFVHKMDYFKANKPAIRSPDMMWDQTNENVNITNTWINIMSSPMSDTITPQLVRHLPDSYACAQNTLLTTKSMNALPYLYPFTIEYNLLLAATFLSLYFNIGKVGLKGIGGSASCRYTLNCSNNGQLNLHNNPASKHFSSHSDNASSIIKTSGGDAMMGAHEREMGEYKSNFVVNADCHSANKGLFCGFFVLLVTLVTIVIFFVTINKPSHVELGIKINLVQEATLTILILLVALAGLRQINKLNKNRFLRDKVSTDDVLMLIPLPFFFIHSLLSFRAETASMIASNQVNNNAHILLGQHMHSEATTSQQAAANAISRHNRNITELTNLLRNLTGVTESTINERTENNNIGNNINNVNRTRQNPILMQNMNRTGITKMLDLDGLREGRSEQQKIDYFKLITLAMNFIVMIEVIVQTNFIIDGMRRCSESRYLRFKKPGRELITFAILLNITTWIVATFETKSVEQYKTEIEYYGPLPYMFISHTTLPVMLFYRYHSSVCLTEIWNRAYKPAKRSS